MLLEMLYTPFVKWGWDFAPKVVHGLFGFLTGLLLYSYLAHRLSPLYGLIGFFFFISTPIVFELSHLAHAELGLTFYSTAALLCLLLWIEQTEAKAWLVLAALSAGFAVATKPNGLALFLLVFFPLLLLVRRPAPKSARESLGQTVFFLLFFFIPLSPWISKGLISAENPLPSLFNLFASSSEEGGKLGVGGLVMAQSLYVLNPLLVFFLPWSFKGKWVSEKKLLSSFAVGYFLYAFFLVDLPIRDLLPVLPPLVVLFVYSVHNIYLRIVRPFFLYAAVVLLLVPNGLYFWGYFSPLIEYLLFSFHGKPSVLLFAMPERKAGLPNKDYGH